MITELIVHVKDKNRIEELSEYGTISYISKHLNLIIMKVPSSKIKLLQSHTNVLSVRENEVGQYLT